MMEYRTIRRESANGCAAPLFLEKRRAPRVNLGPRPIVVEILRELSARGFAAARRFGR
jgi:hypothetical protein